MTSMPQIDTGTPKSHVTVYQSFRGVDMTTDPLAIDRSRSPWAPNMISDNGGNPEKRTGWRVLHQLEQPINGMFSAVIDGQFLCIIHGGAKLYAWNLENDPVQIADNMQDARSTAAAMGGKLWILDGKNYRVYGMFDGERALKDVSEIAYTPTTTIARDPTGGGAVYEEVNLLSSRRKNSFIGDGAAVEYQLDAAPLDDETPVTIKVGEEEKTQGTDFTVNYELGKITFTSPPPKPEVAGSDNVFIEFQRTNAEYYQRIAGCTISIIYGVGSNDRLFVSGNKDYPSYDWHSQINDPSYMPDLNYAMIGSDDTAVMGYLRIGEQLAIIKEDNALDSTIFLRSASLNADQTKALFPLKQGVTGVGAISPYSFAYLGDEPLFLSRRGIYGLTSNLITAERTVQNRSFFVDTNLIKEPGLEEAAACEWNGIFIVALPNGNAYLLDGKQNKSYKPKSNNEYVYECYHWTNIPARVWFPYQNDLYFGTADGRICRFNNDMHGVTQYNDDGAAIACSWATLADADGYASHYKTMKKRGCIVIIKPYVKSSVKISVRTEKDYGNMLRYETMDIFDWEYIDFSRFSFNSNDAPQTIPVNRKVKKYITAQIIVANDALNEGFGVFRIEKTYTVGAYVK